MNKEDVKYLKVTVGGYVTDDPIGVTINGKEFETFDEAIKEFTELSADPKSKYPDLMLIIDVKTGEVINWPKGNSYDFYNIKVCDEGTYTLLDKDMNMLYTYCGYVPKCIGDNYGDYFEFEINEKGFIPEWNFSDDDYKKLMKND